MPRTLTTITLFATITSSTVVGIVHFLYLPLPGTSPLYFFTTLFVTRGFDNSIADDLVKIHDYSVCRLIARRNDTNTNGLAVWAGTYTKRPISFQTSSGLEENIQKKYQQST